jgi:diguanylate cyclase (GGDEF)-like protein/PAS domain S-box-containing protein
VNPVNEDRLVGLTAAALFVGAGLIATANTLAPGPLGADGIHRTTLRFCVVACFASAFVVTRLGRRSSRLPVRLGIAVWGLVLLMWSSVLAHYAVTAQAVIVLPVFLIMILVWLGLTSERGVATAFTPVAIGAMALVKVAVPDSRFGIANVVVVASVAAVIAETIAWAMRELRRREELLSVQAATDPLTGLLNRSELRGRLAQSCRAGEHIMLAFVDLNGFKDVNDTFGHQVGDAVLVEAAERLRHITREGDVVARFGGDEFVVVFREEGRSVDEREVLGRIRRTMDRPWPMIAPASLTVSVGMVEGGSDGATAPDDLLRAADTAMYARKHGMAAAHTPEMTSRSLNRYRAAMNGLGGSFTVLRALFDEGSITDWQIIEANNIVRARFAALVDDLVGTKMSELDRYADNASFHDVYIRALETGKEQQVETLLQLPALSPAWRRLVVVPVDDGVVAAMTFDISSEKNAEQALRDAEGRSRAIVEAAGDAILTADQNGMIHSFNRAAEAMFGVTAERVVGRSYTCFVPDQSRAPLHEAVVTAGQPVDVELTRESGETFRAQVAISQIETAHGALYTVIARDVTVQYNTERALRHALERDELTGLANQRSLLQHTERALAAVAESDGTVGVVFVDLDRFTLINDSLGHERGDRLLVLVAERLASALESGDVLARLGGDHFGLTRSRIESIDELRRLAERLVEALRGPFTLDDDNDVFITASIGIAQSQGAESARDLLRFAHTAKQRTKYQTASVVGIFEREMSTSIASRLELETALRRAVSRDELCAHYQPIVALDTGTIKEFEALVRWQRPDHGLVSPDEFIPLAEETGIIVDIGAWILRRAVEDCAAWQSHAPGVGVAVNVSSRQFHTSDFAAVVSDALSHAGLRPELLTLEITESVMLDDTEQTMRTMHNIRDLGAQLALDDFGTGYSSLTYLRQLPIDRVKIDQSFLHSIETEQDLPVIHAIIQLANAHNLSVIVEGIETETTRALLQSAGCALGQGFLYAKPAPLDLAMMLLAIDSAITRSQRDDVPHPRRGPAGEHLEPDVA